MFDQSDRDELASIAAEHDQVVKVERLTHQMTRVREAVDRIDMTLAKMADALTRLALVEERQANTSNAITRLTDVIEKLDERLRRLEVAEPLQAKSSELVMNAVWALCAAAVMFVASKAGLL